MSDIDNKRQQEAIDRAREMYSRRTPDYRQQGFPSGYNGNIKRRTSAQGNREEKTDHSEEVFEETDTAEAEHGQHKANEKPEETFLDMLLNDKERTLIILLLALLSEEKANTSLMLALMYIIM